MLLAAPVPESSGLWRVEVLDATASPHGSDSRPKGASGVGRGVMWFRTDAAGRPEAFLWSRPDGVPGAMPINIGRPVDAGG
jgi:hypothetical protein